MNPPGATPGHLFPEPNIGKIDYYINLNFLHSSLLQWVFFLLLVWLILEGERPTSVFPFGSPLFLFLVSTKGCLKKNQM